jgi:hypothetical protein
MEMEKLTADNGFSLWRIKMKETCIKGLIDALRRLPATFADKEKNFISNVRNTIKVGIHYLQTSIIFVYFA